MSLARMFVSIVAKSSRFAKTSQSPFGDHKHSFVLSLVTCRFVATHHVTKNIELISQDPKDLQIKQNTKSSGDSSNPPLLVILSWLLSKRKHLMKFANLYMEQGFDVVTVSVHPWQLMWPVKGTRVIAKDLLTFLDQNKSYEQIMLHGFSVGGYMWGEVLELIEQDRKKYDHVIERIIGQVWDSAADISELTIGTPRAVFPKNEVMQKVLAKYLDYHMKTFYNSATQYYIRSSQLFHMNLVRTPALFLLSNTDPVGAVSSNMRVRDSWDSLGIETYVKIFNESPHVGHFQKYPKEYVHELYTFLDKLNMISNEEKIRSRL
ncbi:transmembrane protein 53 isoform X2 [Venturia canescens]|nr:transmembrane protein 53 isoform X2 [Venturia canescens]XP_043275367.1 transmembrane protein 53 isoform X2 [Venturia canescens]XP_043275375.1 transmembrane protein 53 isoform X2 [Venturia canescens]